MNAPSERALIAWWTAKGKTFAPGTLLACSDCGKVDSPAYVQPQHPFYAGGRDDIARCGDCIDARNRLARAARKAALAGRPKDCDRCQVHPHTYIYGGYRLCGRCKTATTREHTEALATAGALGIFATSLLVDTSTWACGRREDRP